MKKLSHKRVEELLKVLEETKNTHFKDKQHNYPYTEWEHNRIKIKERLSNIHDYIRQAVEIINLEEQKTGRPPKLDLEQKTNLFILTRLLNKSNRAIEEILPFLQPFVVDVELSYKYIERLYSDPEVKLALHNVFMLLLKDEKVSGDLAGDGTGYAVSVENQHYRSCPEKHGKKFVHFFALIDIASGLYVGCGVSRISEMDAYTKAVAMLKRLDISLKSLRLDKYFSCRKIIQQFDRSVSLFLIPKKNLCRIKTWRDILERILESPVSFLKQYFKRNLSESCFSADKGRFSSIIKQKRDDRQQSALFSNTLLHNIFTVRTNPK